MPTYEYECKACGLRFERWQAMTAAPVSKCPECNGEVRRLVSGGAGFILKGNDRSGAGRSRNSCAFEETGKTCCGLDQPCGESSCEKPS